MGSDDKIDRPAEDVPAEVDERADEEKPAVDDTPEPPVARAQQAGEKIKAMFKS